MQDEWILVANGSMARLFSRAGSGDPLVALETIDFPEGRQQAHEVGRDRPGHDRSDNSSSGALLEPRTSLKHKLHERFAHQLAERLDDGLADGAYSGLWVIASSPFLGSLRSALSDAVAPRVRLSHDADFTGLDVSSLEARLQTLAKSKA
ncbi:host attachment protein [Hydrogenophaga sp.]|uniref:host attachment protein n=1 Tax=Hydrogenophaga sp. TaxID=1904254 RepID=UPI0035ADF373